MRIAFLGDIVGTPGRQALTQQLPTIREQYGASLVIANAENIANGSGITPEQYKKLKAAGVDGLTLGDHAFRKQQIHATLNEANDMIRPINLPGRAWGKGWMRLNIDSEPELPPVVVCTVMGRLFMNSVQADDPFAAIDRLLDSLKNERCIVIIEAHAEATSEKVALGWHANGRVAAVVGSHTHIPTADARLLPAPGSDLSIPLTQGASATDPDATPAPLKTRAESSEAPDRASKATINHPQSKIKHGLGTAYVTDLGMTGPQDSVLGRRVDRVVHHMSTGLPAAFDVADANPVVHGVLIDIDPATRLATHIQRLFLPADVTKAPFTSSF